MNELKKCQKCGASEVRPGLFECGSQEWPLYEVTDATRCLRNQLAQCDVAIKVKDKALESARKLALMHEEISADYVLMEVEEALAIGRSKQ